MSASSFEVPGFRISGSPSFTGALGTSMFTGVLPAPTPVLDLAMVFGSRLWGHDEIPIDADVLGSAPGVGDLYGHELRDLACSMLCHRVASELHEPVDDWSSLVLHTGSEAVEFALKSALRATGRIGLVAFKGGYHGTSGLALSVTHNARFRDSWAAQLPSTVRWASWGLVPALDSSVSCVIVEPWQGRSGIIAPPNGFLALLREECDRVGAVLILDAVLCGSGRTGATIAQDITEARPDIICLGKAIGSGVTASAVVMRRSIALDAWDRGPVEPAHTSTSIGDPLACAGIIASLERLSERKLLLEVAAAAWQVELLRLVSERSGLLTLRGLGLLWALDTDITDGGVVLARSLLRDHNILVVPSGPTASSITIYPAVGCSDLERERFSSAIRTITS